MNASRPSDAPFPPGRWWRVVLLLAIIPRLSAAAVLEDELIAHYRLNGNTADATGRNGPPELERASYDNGALFFNGVYHSTPEKQAVQAIFPVRDLDYESFTVAVDFRPAGFAPVRTWNRAQQAVDVLTLGLYGQLVPPRQDDNTTIFTGGHLWRWLGFRVVNDNLELTLNNQDTVHTFTGVKVKPGCWHNLICSFDLSGRKILTLLDGQRLETIILPADFKLHVVGSAGQADDNNFAFANYSVGSAYHGHAANLKVFGRALDESRLAAIYHAAAKERAALVAPGSSSHLWFAVGGIGLGLIFLLARTLSKRLRARRVLPHPAVYPPGQRTGSPE